MQPYCGHFQLHILAVGSIGLRIIPSGGGPRAQGVKKQAARHKIALP